MELQITIQQRYLKNADEINPHQRDEQTANDADESAITQQKTPQEAGGDAKRDKGQGETEDKSKRVRCHPPAHAAIDFGSAHLLQRNAGDKGKIRRDQRQHAGGEKREQAGCKGDRNIKVGHFFPANKVWKSSRPPGPYHSAGPQSLASPSPLGPLR